MSTPTAIHGFPARAATQTPRKAAAARMSNQDPDGTPWNTDAGAVISFQAPTASRMPTPSCNARITGRVNHRASHAPDPPSVSRSRIAPSSIPAALIVAGESSFATASAVSAFSGCTGNGMRKATPAAITSAPAQTSTAPALSPFTRISAVASGTKMPRSATDPATSPMPMWNAERARVALTGPVPRP